MPVRAFTDIDIFLDHAMPLLLQNEAAYCLSLGILNHLQKNPKNLARYRMGTIEESGRPSGFFLWGPDDAPRPLQISKMARDGVSDVIRYLQENSLRPTGVIAETSTAELFFELWNRVSQTSIAKTMRQGVFSLSEVIHPAYPADQSFRAAVDSDYDLILEWNDAFIRDCRLDPPRTEEMRLQMARGAIANGNRYFWISENNEIVSMLECVGKTPNGIRITWVYTPARHRGKGYASRLVAKISQKMLDQGNQLCFLYTDLSNPTSNKIYQSVGYEFVWSSVHFDFEHLSTGAAGG